MNFHLGVVFCMISSIDIISDISLISAAPASCLIYVYLEPDEERSVDGW